MKPLSFAITVALLLIGGARPSHAVDEHVGRSKSGTAVFTVDDSGILNTTGGFTENGTNLLSNDIEGAIVLPAKVNEASGISVGQCVFISGATGQVPQVSLCDNTDLAKEPFFGIAAETKSNGQNILITQRGKSATFNTSSFADGAELYMTTGGGLTATKPTSGVVTSIGYVGFSHTSNGYLIVGTHSESTLGATSGNDIVLRSGDSAGSNKVSFRDFTNVEVAAIDSNGNLTLSGTVDGVDIAARDHAKTTDASELTSGSLPAARIDSGLITTAKLGSGSVTTEKLNDDSVLKKHLSADGCTTDQILKVGAGGAWVCAEDSGGTVGAVVQSVMTTFCDTPFTTTVILANGSIPQITEGLALFDVTITPTDSDNLLRIETLVHIGGSAGASGVIPLFKDSVANAISVSYAETKGGEDIPHASMVHERTAGTTSAQTYKLRIGTRGGVTIRVNRSANTADTYGVGTICSTIKVEEIQQ